MLTKSNMAISNEPFQVWREKKRLHKTGKTTKKLTILCKQLVAKCVMEFGSQASQLVEYWKLPGY